MKKLTLSILLLSAVAIKTASAQTAEHLKLSDPYPAAGEKITFTYDPTGTNLEGKTGVEGVIYFLDNKDNPAIDLDFKSDGKLLTGSFKVPESAKFFFVKLSKDTSIDNNSKLGYTYFIYKNQTPVAGAYALKAYMLNSGLGNAYGKIKADPALAINLYQKEFAAHPESKTDYQATYTNYLMSSKDPATKALATGQVIEMAQSGEEKKMSSAASFLTRMKKTKEADSLKAVIKAKFPDAVAKSDMISAMSKEEDLPKKEVLLNELAAKYPDGADEKNTLQNSYKLQLAYGYLEAGKVADYNRVAATIADKSNLPVYLNAGAHDMAKKDQNLEEALNLSKLSIDMTNERLKHPAASPYRSPKSTVEGYKSSLSSYENTYALILTKLGKFKEAYVYEKPAYEKSKGDNADLNETYATILKELGKNQEAMKVIEDAIPKGKSTTPMVAELKDVYVKVKGSDKGFDDYYAPMRGIYIQKLKTDILKEAINKPAPTFALKDFDGKTVSLADLKGKVVIVDFWATWCGPCKASFPGMQMAVTKYKDDPNVKFVFIDTWETVENYQAEAKKYITDNKYTFHVLYDEKNGDGKHGKIVADYDVSGIPTKFVIDGNGNIRFKKIGWGGSSEVLVDEVATMIEIASHPASAPTGEKVSMIKTDE